MESNGGVASALIHMERFDLGLDYTVNRRLGKVRQAPGYQAVAKKYIDSERLAISIAGPAEVP